MVNKTQIKNMLCVLHALDVTRTNYRAYRTNKQIRESISIFYNSQLSHQHVTYLCDKLGRMKLLTSVTLELHQQPSRNILAYWRR